jgi:hypothetical protein
MSVRSSLYYRRGAGGKIAIEDMAVSTGSRFFVHATTGSDASGYGFSPDKPFASIDYAVGQCTTLKGDIIYVMPGHAETIAATIAADVIGISIIGIGNGRLRPAITGLTATATVTVSAANILLKNLRIIGVSGSSSNIQVTADDLTIDSCVLEAGAGPLKTIRVGGAATVKGTRLHVKDCLFLGTADGPDYAIDFASSCPDNWIVERCKFNYGTFGLDNAGIAVRVSAPQGFLISNCLFMGMDALAIDINSSSAASGDGMITDCRIGASADLGATSVEGTIDPGGAQMFNILVSDASGVRAAYIPLTTAQ